MSEDRRNSLVLSFYVDDLRANGKAQVLAFRLSLDLAYDPISKKTEKLS